MSLSEQKKGVKPSSACCGPKAAGEPAKGAVRGCQCDPCTSEDCTCVPCICVGK